MTQKIVYSSSSILIGVDSRLEVDADSFSLLFLPSKKETGFGINEEDGFCGSSLFNVDFSRFGAEARIFSVRATSVSARIRWMMLRRGLESFGAILNVWRGLISGNANSGVVGRRLWLGISILTEVHFFMGGTMKDFRRSEEGFFEIEIVCKKTLETPPLEVFKEI
jgi:hypothetical protein